MTRPEILDTAKKCVCGDREQDYGTPESNFSTIAQLWTAYKGVELTAVDVAVFLSLVKIGRIASGHGKADNWIDLAGYAACGGEIESAIVAELERLKLSEADKYKAPYDTYLEEMGEEDVSEPLTVENERRCATCALEGTDKCDYEPSCCMECANWRPKDVAEPSEPVKGYEGLSNDGLHNKICLGMSCEKCLLDFTHNDCGGGCWAFQDNHPEEFRKIAIEYLEGLEKQN